MPAYTHDVFISHASEDKEPFVDALRAELKKLGLRVWYDRHELHVGGDLLQELDKGLIASRFGIVVLSPSFFVKHWTLRELSGMLALGTRIFPVRYDLTHEQLVERSPILAGWIAVSASDGVAIVAKAILSAVHRRDALEKDGGAIIPSNVIELRPSPTDNLKRLELLSAVRMARQKQFRNRRIRSSINAIIREHGEAALKQLATEGNADALMVMAHFKRSIATIENENDVRAAILTYVELASSLDEPDPEAFVWMAEVYEGKVLHKDVSKSQTFIKRAAATDHPEGLLAMARAYHLERYGMSADQDAIIDAYQQAISAGSQEANYNLGVYLSSLGGKKRRKESDELIETAASQGLIAAEIEMAIRTSGAPISYHTVYEIHYAPGYKISKTGKSNLRDLLADEDASEYQKEDIRKLLKQN